MQNSSRQGFNFKSCESEGTHHPQMPRFLQEAGLYWGTTNHATMIPQ